MKSSPKIISSDEEWYLAEIDKDYALKITTATRPDSKYLLREVARI